jgi:SAM-dependent methyltransferase
VSRHYAFKDFPGSSHRLLIRAVLRTAPRDGVLLDAGAAGGELAGHLTQYFDHRIGIEGDPDRIPDLRASFDSGWIADLEQVAALPRARVILLADILEHLKDPQAFLRLCREALEPDGRIFVSVPNVANITVRAALLLGRWDYTDKGILDRTHLRFYTRRTILEELRAAGFDAVRVEATTMPIRLVLEGRLPAPLLRWAERLLLTLTALLPRLLGYQWVITARVGDR